MWKSKFIHVQTLNKFLSQDRYKIPCLTNSSSVYAEDSIIKARKYFVEHLLCFMCSTSCFTYAYSLTIKTSCKVRDFLYKWKNWSSLRSRIQKWEQLRISPWSWWLQSSCFFTYSIPVQGHISLYVSTGIMYVEFHKSLDKRDLSLRF